MSPDPIALSDVRVRRGDFELRIDAWRVPPGGVVGVVGPNGAGKTTLLELLPGLRAPGAGTVRVFGQDPLRTPELRARLGFMSADMPLFDLRIGRLLRVLSGYYADWDPALVEELLGRFRLDPARRARELSRGQATRLRLLTALAFRPRLLVLDEPTAGLDLGGRDALMDVVLDVVRDPERTVVISSHALQDVARVCDRLLVLDGGRVVQEGPTDELVGETRTLEEAVRAWGAAG